MTDMPHSREHPQGAKRFNGKTHQVFGHQYISRVEDGFLRRVHTTEIEESIYPDEVDYTTRRSVTGAAGERTGTDMKRAPRGAPLSWRRCAGRQS